MHQPPKRYQHLFFDLDHTLWDFDRNARHALEELYADFRLSETVTPLFDDFYRHYLHHNEILWNRFHQGFITADELKWKRMWRTLLEFKIGNETLAKDMSKRFLELLPVKTHLFPYAMEILTYLKNKGYALHLITNGFEQTQYSKIEHSGIDHFFTHVITSEGSNAVKPNKAIFDYALAKANGNVMESIMIGDNIETDIQGAINVGMDSVFVNHINVSTPVPATYTVSHLAELEQLF